MYTFLGQKNLETCQFKRRMELLKELSNNIQICREDLLFAMQLELGRPRWEAKLDVEAAIRYLEWVYKNQEAIYANLISPASNSNFRGKINIHFLYPIKSPQK